MPCECKAKVLCKKFCGKFHHESVCRKTNSVNPTMVEKQFKSNILSYESQSVWNTENISVYLNNISVKNNVL